MHDDSCEKTDYRDSSSGLMIRLLARICTQTDYQTSYCSLLKLVLDKWSVSNINRAIEKVSSLLLFWNEIMFQNLIKFTLYFLSSGRSRENFKLLVLKVVAVAFKRFQISWFDLRNLVLGKTGRWGGDGRLGEGGRWGGGGRLGEVVLTLDYCREA